MAEGLKGCLGHAKAWTPNRNKADVGETKKQRHLHRGRCGAADESAEDVLYAWRLEIVETANFNGGRQRVTLTSPHDPGDR